MKVYVKSSQSHDWRRQLFENIRKDKEAEWGLQIDKPDVIGWTDDSGDCPLKLLRFDAIKNNKSLEPNMDIDIAFDQLYDSIEYLSYGEAIRAFRQYGLEVPDWILDEMSGMF